VEDTEVVFGFCPSSFLPSFGKTHSDQISNEVSEQVAPPPILMIQNLMLQGFIFFAG